MSGQVDSLLDRAFRPRPRRTISAEGAGCAGKGGWVEEAFAAALPLTDQPGIRLPKGAAGSSSSSSGSSSSSSSSSSRAHQGRRHRWAARRCGRRPPGCRAQRGCPAGGKAAPPQLERVLVLCRTVGGRRARDVAAGSEPRRRAADAAPGGVLGRHQGGGHARLTGTQPWKYSAPFSPYSSLLSAVICKGRGTGQKRRVGQQRLQAVLFRLARSAS